MIVMPSGRLLKGKLAEPGYVSRCSRTLNRSEDYGGFEQTVA